MKIPTMTSACILLALSGPALTQEAGSEGREVGQTVFATIDASNRGAIHAGELEDFRDAVFASMDTNGDRRVPFEEFVAWDPGFARVAEEAGRLDQYTTAARIVFAFWDRDGSGEMTEQEMRFAMVQDFRRADLDDDTLLTEDEFLQGFPIMVAMRAAIRPDL
ncbi:EF-hand domain-containing protein [Hasllibacter sp. MH4015]|uniref:EF-hand domain-containing protein n=1 Tax=Hasllibacter sp. MH4015 TaxID=2854029 RepID=UPI001CD800B4|nr:EF-hand domain-containing protein [Hasllibacter sp. MH4015]